MGGAGGVGGAGGAKPAPPSQVPGLWEGEANGFEVCFYIDDEGLRLTNSAMCNVSTKGSGPAPRAPGRQARARRSYDLNVDLVGTDENGAPCSFALSFEEDVYIDQMTNSFRASQARDGSEIAFSGELIGDRASGVARRDSGGSFCRVGWEASKSSQCNEAAIQSCLDLQDCCRLILVSPVFFESCNSVVLQCDQVQCLELLAGYPQCAPEP